MVFKTILLDWVGVRDSTKKSAEQFVDCKEEKHPIVSLTNIICANIVITDS